MGRIPARVCWVSALTALTGCAKQLRSQSDTATRSAGFGQTTPPNAPACQHVGTANEGWYLNGRLLQRTNCNGRFAECSAESNKNGTWVSVVRRNIRLVRFETCEEKTAPACVNTASKSEGWQAPDWFQWDSCAELGIACQNVGTRSEGWYSFEKGDLLPIDGGTCASR